MSYVQPGIADSRINAHLVMRNEWIEKSCIPNSSSCSQNYIIPLQLTFLQNIVLLFRDELTLWEIKPITCYVGGTQEHAISGIWELMLFWIVLASVTINNFEWSWVEVCKGLHAHTPTSSKFFLMAAASLAASALRSSGSTWISHRDWWLFIPHQWACGHRAGHIRQPCGSQATLTPLPHSVPEARRVSHTWFPQSQSPHPPFPAPHPHSGPG